MAAFLALVLIAPFVVAQGTPTDDRIYDEVRRRLANDVDVKGAGIDVMVKNGAVTMRGKVHAEKAREKAERIAKKVKGVASVKNELKIFGTD
jgi:osmotically-inducible protein OsmY